MASHGDRDPVSEKIRLLLELERSGAEVLMIGADVGDIDQMTAAVAQAKQRFGAIHGVVHAAGAPSDGVILHKTREAAESVFAPKVRGALVLDRLLEDQPLDFFVLCSSLSSICGLFGHADYSGADSFLDAFAHYRTARGAFTVSVNWDTWSELGIAPGAATSHEQGTPPEGGVEAFLRILGIRLPQVAVSTQPVKARIEQAGMVAASVSSEEMTKVRAAAHQRPELGVAFEAPRSEHEEVLAFIWQELLGIDQVGIWDNFYELGGDSIIGLQVVARANQAGIRITPRQLFENQTVAELAAVIALSSITGPEESIPGSVSTVAALSQAEIDDLVAEFGRSDD
jgi:aryl carrier-like protein